MEIIYQWTSILQQQIDYSHEIARGLTDKVTPGVSIHGHGYTPFERERERERERESSRRGYEKHFYDKMYSANIGGTSLIWPFGPAGSTKNVSYNVYSVITYLFDDPLKYVERDSTLLWIVFCIPVKQHIYQLNSTVSYSVRIFQFLNFPIFQIYFSKFCAIRVHF